MATYIFEGFSIDLKNISHSFKGHGSYESFYNRFPFSLSDNIFDNF